MQGGRNASDALLPGDVGQHQSLDSVRSEVLESLALHSTRALLRNPADRNWLERYWVAAFALGYQLRRRAIASNVIAIDLKRFYGDEFLESMGAPVDLELTSPWPSLMVRPHYPTRLAAPKHVIMLTVLEHADLVATLDHAPYRRPGPPMRDYRKVDALALRRMRAYVKANALQGQRLTVRSLIEASGEQPCMKRFRERFPRSLAFLAQFRRSRYAARRIRLDSNSDLSKSS